MNKEFSDWYNSYPNGEPSYQETFEAGQAAVLAKLRGGVELPEPYATLHHDDGYFTTKQREHDLRYSGPLRTEVFTRDQLLAYGAAQRLAGQQRETCTWKEQDDKDMPGTYESSCGEMWSFIDGGVKENRITYCHHCGGKVVPASPREQT